MIAEKDIANLIRIQGQLDRPVLSVYLDVDQSKPRNRNRQYIATLKGLLREAQARVPDSEAERAAFSAGAERALEFVEQWKPQGKGLVAFCESSSDFWWNGEVACPIKDLARWEQGMYLRPLVEQLDEYERYGVVLLDRGRARLFTVHLGEISEHEGVFAAADVKRTKTVGTDHWRSQMHFERNVDEHMHSHVKRVAAKLAEVDRAERFDRLILAGEIQARTELADLLPKRLQRKVVASMNLSFETPVQEVLRATLDVELRIEREEELETVQNLLTIAAKNQRAVTSLQEVLKVLGEGRVHRLVYADDFTPPGAECLDCGTLSSSQEKKCPQCGSDMSPVEDLVNSIVERVGVGGGKIECVKESAAERLTEEAGGIGAFLRF